MIIPLLLLFPIFMSSSYLLDTYGPEAITVSGIHHLPNGAFIQDFPNLLDCMRWEHSYPKEEIDNVECIIIRKPWKIHNLGKGDVGR